MVSEMDLAALCDERAIVRLLHDYGYFTDYGEKQAWVDLFTPDARLILRYRATLNPRRIGTPEKVGDDLVYQGTTALAKFSAAHSNAPDRWHKHVVCNWRIDLGGEAATVTSYFTRVDATDSGARIVAAGRYRDSVRRCDDGRWRFAERVAEIEIQ